MARIPIEDFTAAVRRAGLDLNRARITELYAAWEKVEAMLDRIRTPAPPRDAEPATIFKPVKFS